MTTKREGKSEETKGWKKEQGKGVGKFGKFFAPKFKTPKKMKIL